MTGRFFVRTYGCQMNEHDSERIAGLLAADGMEPTDDRRRRRRRRAQHLLHPGERRQQALRPPRPPEGAEGRRGPTCRSWSAAAWPRRTATLIARAGAVTSTSCSAPTTSHRAADAARTRPRGERPDHRDPRASDDDAYPSALPARRDVDHAAWVTIQIGCDNSCAFCIVPVGARRARSAGRSATSSHEVEALAADGVVEVTLLGQNVNSYGRDLGAGAVPRPHVRRPAARASTRSTASAASASPSPHPKDLRPETIAAMAECAAVCEHLHLPLQSGSDRTLAAHAPRLHRRALPRAAGRGPRRDRPISPSPPTSSSASPARPTTTSSARSRWSPPPSTTPPTRSSSRPGRAPRPPTMTDDFVAARGRRGAHSSGCASSSSAARWPSTRPASAGSRRCSSRARRKKDPADARRAAPARTSWCTSAAPQPLRAGTYATVAITGAAPHFLRGELRRGAPPAAATAPASPSPRPEQSTRATAALTDLSAAPGEADLLDAGGWTAVTSGDRSRVWRVDLADSSRRVAVKVALEHSNEGAAGADTGTSRVGPRAQCRRAGWPGLRPAGGAGARGRARTGTRPGVDPVLVTSFLDGEADLRLLGSSERVHRGVGPHH